MEILIIAGLGFIALWLFGPGQPDIAAPKGSAPWIKPRRDGGPVMAPVPAACIFDPLLKGSPGAGTSGGLATPGPTADPAVHGSPGAGTSGGLMTPKFGIVTEGPGLHPDSPSASTVPLSTPDPLASAPVAAVASADKIISSGTGSDGVSKYDIWQKPNGDTYQKWR